MNDINNEKCFEKLEIEDELQHVLTNSFFNKSRNLHETIGVIINLIEKEKEIDFSSYTFSTKPSNRVKIGNEVIDIFWKILLFSLAFKGKSILPIRFYSKKQRQAP